ncbi:MAG TPA: site-2 protease family protein, partial [Actinomycetes bacterium]|nr:site-2 protease family protein [Actinomycetes bacterium]
LGTPFGVPVYLSWTWFAGALVITWLFVPLVERRLPGSEGWATVIAFCFAVLLGLSVLIHELAHAVMALRLGQSVRRITLHLLGGVSEIEGDQRRPWVDFAIAVVGPVASLALAGIGFALVATLPEQTVIYVVALQLAAANLIVGLFNLVPGLPLDGGRMLRDVVWAATGREHTGTTVAAWTGRALAVLLLFLAVLPLLLGGNDVIWLAWGILLAGFIWTEAGRALQSARVRSTLPRLSVRSLTRRALPVPEDMPVSEGLRQLAAAQAGALVTTDRAGRPVGVVHEGAVAALPEIRRPWVAMSAVARSLAGSPQIAADLDGDALVHTLSTETAAEYLVVEPDGSVYGVLARADVEAAIASMLAQR